MGIGGSDVLPGSGSDSQPERDEAPDQGGQGGETSEENDSDVGEQSTDPSPEEADDGAKVTLESNDPVTVVETFYEALYAPDLEMANGLLHPESPAPMYTDEVVSSFEAYTHKLEDVELVEESDSSAVVAFILVLTGGEGVVRRSEVTLEVRTDGDDWKVWQMRR
ncbi:hypothetical protein BN903_383 [Halorubrum sp. AJ67]|nr:hypothetical protein BN903_383 [Halorubrum sp. AJ67]